VAVAQYLIGQGISPKRVVCAGCSEYRPRAANTDNQGKAQNRRVEVYAVSRSASLTR
jgi:outer membrane protein OmpA-like peptidoglycan-associated protein